MYKLKIGDICETTNIVFDYDKKIEIGTKFEITGFTPYTQKPKSKTHFIVGKTVNGDTIRIDFEKFKKLRKNEI